MWVNAAVCCTAILAAGRPAGSVEHFGQCLGSRGRRQKPRLRSRAEAGDKGVKDQEMDHPMIDARLALAAVTLVLDAMRAMHAAGTTRYAVLSDAQKKVADELMAGSMANM